MPIRLRCRGEMVPEVTVCPFTGLWSVIHARLVIGLPPAPAKGPVTTGIQRRRESRKRTSQASTVTSPATGTSQLTAVSRTMPQSVPSAPWKMPPGFNLQSRKVIAAATARPTAAPTATPITQSLLFTSRFPAAGLHRLASVSVGTPGVTLETDVQCNSFRDVPPPAEKALCAMKVRQTGL